MTLTLPLSFFHIYIYIYIYMCFHWCNPFPLKRDEGQSYHISDSAIAQISMPLEVFDNIVWVIIALNIFDILCHRPTAILCDKVFILFLKNIIYYIVISCLLFLYYSIILYSPLTTNYIYGKSCDTRIFVIILHL